MRSIYHAIGILIVFCLSASLHANILPPNNLHLEDHLHRQDANVTAEQLAAEVAKIQRLYGPIANVFGNTLEVSGYWEVEIVNAFASRSLNYWYVAIYGGMARRPEMTLDAVTLVLCHEIGHHIAGFPTKANSWAAAEGQSDYFATHSCLTKLWKDEIEINRSSRNKIDPVGKEICDNQYHDQDAQNLCYRKILASISIANLLATLQGVEKVDLETPHTGVVEATLTSHPHAQCRLDTYVAGNMCDKQWDDRIIPADERQSVNYACSLFEGYETESRPLCWFKPTL
jgi:hypothetical protein